MHKDLYTCIHVYAYVYIYIYIYTPTVSYSTLVLKTVKNPSVTEIWNKHVGVSYAEKIHCDSLFLVGRPNVLPHDLVCV